MNDRRPPPPRHAATSTQTGTPPRYHSETLFANGRTVVIAHAGREYRLSVTAGNKLILTA